ncbi:MAG: protoporphyrinogen oxidase [Labilithrix sp.]|nr:protoporphyrinogen oxidase [Labilithrix sp.]MCW5817030.1 protoporphyrinogen oxidase [Labilithrix sp.]
MKRVVIVGGGITGLAAAHALEKADERHDVDIVEKGPQLGGNLQTIRHNGFIIDAGPDSWVAAKPHATRLAREVGLGDELIGTRPDTRRVYIVHQRKLHAMPEGLILGVPTEISPFVDSELLGWDAKLRAGLDFVVPQKKWKDNDDESIASFVTRRLGGEVSDRLAGPLLGGIFAGDPESLSVRACVPQLVEAEREHGSIIRAMRALKAKRKAQAASGEATAFVSLKRGVGDLVVNVAHKLRDAEIANSRTVKGLARLPEGDARGRWLVKTSDGAMFADDVVLSVPANAASKIVADLDPTLAGELGAIEYASAATVFLAYRKFDVRHPLDAFGILIPRSENRPILACTFVSSKWDHRAPSGQVLLRVFVGGAGNEEMLDREDKDLVRLARSQIFDLLNIDRAPMFTRVFRFRDSSPQPHVGHLGRVRRILARAAEHPGLHLGGSGYVGTGIPDMVRQGEEIAARIIAR